MGVGVSVAVAVLVGVGVRVGVATHARLFARHGVGSGHVGVIVGVAVGVAVRVAVGVGVAVLVAVGVAVIVEVNVAVGVAVSVGVGVNVSVAVGVAVAVSVTVGVAVRVGVAVSVGVAVRVGVAVTVAVAVAVGVAVAADSMHEYPHPKLPGSVVEPVSVAFISMQPPAAALTVAPVKEQLNSASALVTSHNSAVVLYDRSAQVRPHAPPGHTLPVVQAAPALVPATHTPSACWLPSNVTDHSPALGVVLIQNAPAQEAPRPYEGTSTRVPATPPLGVPMFPMRMLSPVSAGSVPPT